MGDAGDEMVGQRADLVGWGEAQRLANLGAWVFDARAGVLTWSAEMYRIVGLDPEGGPLQLDDYWRAVHEDDREAVAAAVQRLTDDLVPLEWECRIVRPDGEVRWLHMRAEAVADEAGDLLRLTGFGQDVTDRQLADRRRVEAQERLARHEAVLERIARNEPMAETLAALCHDIEDRYPTAICSVLLADTEAGVLRHAAAPSLPDVVVEALDGLPMEEGMGACGTAAFRRETVVVVDTLVDPLTAPFVDLATDHGLRSVWSQPLLDPAGEPLGTFALYRSEPHEPDAEEVEAVRSAAGLASLAIERERTVRALTAAANVDPLTGLPNRARFLDCLTDRLEVSDSVAVMFLDLDRFKWINDSLGHPTGDAILVQVAHRLAKVLRPVTSSPASVATSSPSS